MIYDDDNIHDALEKIAKKKWKLSELIGLGVGGAAIGGGAHALMRSKPKPAFPGIVRQGVMGSDQVQNVVKLTGKAAKRLMRV